MFPSTGGRPFASDELNRRVEQALAHSPSVASAQAALRQAQENTNAARGGLFPSVDAKAGATRGNKRLRRSDDGCGADAAPRRSRSTTPASTSATRWILFGGVRRTVEAQSALADAQRFQLEGTYLSLAANVATASFREASLREQIHATEQIIADYQDGTRSGREAERRSARNRCPMCWSCAPRSPPCRRPCRRCARRSSRRRRNSRSISASSRRRRNSPRSISMR